MPLCKGHCTPFIAPFHDRMAVCMVSNMSCSLIGGSSLIELHPQYCFVLVFHLKLRLKPGKVRRKRAPHTNQKHFFENPNRYDENEQLLYHPVQRQGSTSTHVSIPSLTGSTPLYPHLQQQYGSTNGVGQRPTQHQHSKHYSINNSHHHGNSHPVHASVMPGTTPPQLFTSPSFFTDQ